MPLLKIFLPIVLLAISLQLAFSQVAGQSRPASSQVSGVSNFLTDHFQNELGQYQYVYDIKVSNNGLVAAALIFVSPPGRGGSDYASLLIAHLNKEQDKVLSEFVYLPAKEFATEAGEPSVSELGQISNRGDKILLRVGTQSAPVAPYTCSYNWQIREVPSGRKIDHDIFGEN
jgi:hypothetical protein